jgi:hypothetical protein
MRASEFITEESKSAKINGLILKYAFNDRALIMKAFESSTRNPLGYVKFVKENKELYPQDLWVNDEHRNRGIAKSMYDYLKSEGYVINRSHDQTKAGAGFWDKHRGEDAYVWEDVGNATTLNNLYNGNYPDRDETFWDYVSSSELDTPLTIQTLQKHKVMFTLLGQYRAEHIDEITDMLDDDRKELVQSYIDDPALSSKLIVLSGNRIIDGNHRALAAAIKGVPINYVDLADLEETDVNEEVLDEMPLPADWDPQQMRQQGTTFKSRLAYALERAKKLGTGSSRVATIIDYEGRPTVLKIAKNQKGLAQNSVEASILDDGYASQMGILIPLIDYDTQNRDPSWIHTELAQKANEKQLCSLMKCQSLYDLIKAAHAQLNEFSNSRAILNDILDKNSHFGSSEQDNDTFLEYVNRLAELKSSFDIELADFYRPVNWGLYKGKPVIIDVGFNSNVMNQYYR